LDEEETEENVTLITDYADSNEYDSFSYQVLVNRVFANNSNHGKFLIEAIIFNLFYLNDVNTQKFKENFEIFMENNYNHNDQNISLRVISVEEKFEKNETILWLNLDVISGASTYITAREGRLLATIHMAV
jgi:hypothetical protein